MPIEDVQYLLENSVQESSLVFVDSSRRDRAFYATPSKYVVDFDEPLRYVFGFDVLDAAIPATMYNVDLNNNRLRLGLLDRNNSTSLTAFSPTPTYSAAQRTAEQENFERDVLGTEFMALGHNPEVKSFVYDNARPYSMLVMSDTMFNANLPPASEVLAEADASGGHVVLIRHGIRGVPLFMPHTTVAAPGSFSYQGTVYALMMPTATPANTALSKWLSATDAAFTVMRSSTHWTESAFAGVSQSSPLFDIVYYRTVYITPVQHASYVASAGKPMATGREPLEIWLAWTLKTVTLEPGNYTTGTLQLHLQEVLMPSALFISSTSSSTIEKQGIYKFEGPQNARFLLCTDASTASSLLGFSLYPSATQATLSPEDRKYNPLVFGTQTNTMFMSVLKYNQTSLTTGQSLQAPGLANLLGVRYITLRCPEIEQHMSTTGKYGSNSTGLGVFKLANVNEVSQVRFDFVSLIRKPFHPIGRLKRLTLIFQMIDGTLYDFKGMDHQMLISLKYYSPTTKRVEMGAIRSVLNPDYDPDFQRYMLRQQKDAARATDDRAGYADESDEAEGDGDREGDGEGGGGGDKNDADLRRRVMLEQYKNDFFNRN